MGSEVLLPRYQKYIQPDDGENTEHVRVTLPTGMCGLSLLRLAFGLEAVEFRTAIKMFNCRPCGLTQICTIIAFQYSWTECVCVYIIKVW